jgi:hypothetical protein
MHFDVIQSFISPTNAQLICFKILKFTLKYTINAFIIYLLFIIYLNVNFNILKQINCALVGLIKDWMNPFFNL